MILSTSIKEAAPAARNRPIMSLLEGGEMSGRGAISLIRSKLFLSSEDGGRGDQVDTGGFSHGLPLPGTLHHQTPQSARVADFLPRFLPKPPVEARCTHRKPLLDQASSRARSCRADHSSKLVMRVRFPSSAP